MSKQKLFHRPEKLLEKTREIDNKARISKETEEAHNSVRNPAKLSSIIFLVNRCTLIKIVIT